MSGTGFHNHQSSHTRPDEKMSRDQPPTNPSGRRYSGGGAPKTSEQRAVDQRTAAKKRRQRDRDAGQEETC